MLIIKRLSLALLMLCGTVGVFAQKTALKTNVLYDVTGSINVGAEFELTPKWTFDISGNYNAWDFSNDRKWRHILVQPEARYWFCESFNGHFIGIHAHWLKFNIGNVTMPFGLWKETRTNRFEGDMWGVVSAMVITGSYPSTGILKQKLVWATVG